MLDYYNLGFVKQTVRNGGRDQDNPKAQACKWEADSRQSDAENNRWDSCPHKEFYLHSIAPRRPSTIDCNATQCKGRLQFIENLLKYSGMEKEATLQVSIRLPMSVVLRIDKDAKAEHRARANLLTSIIIEYDRAKRKVA
jgi:hypothetical protein